MPSQVSIFAIAVQLLSNLKIDPQHILTILATLEEECQTLDLSEICLDLIAPALHKIFLQSVPKGRASVIRIICDIQSKSSADIVSFYHFDKLVALSIDVKVPDPPPKFDDERAAAFRLIHLLLRLGFPLPNSFVRALICLYYTPKTVHKNLVAIYILDDLTRFPQIGSIPEIAQLVLDIIRETQYQFVWKYLSFALENSHPIFGQKLFVQNINSIFAQSDPNPSFIENLTDNLQNYLLTWPGFLQSGIENGLFRDMLLFLSKHFDILFPVLLTFLTFPSRSSIIDPFLGFAFYILKENGLFQVLNDFLSNDSKAKSVIPLVMTLRLTPLSDDSQSQLLTPEFSSLVQFSSQTFSKSFVNQFSSASAFRSDVFSIGSDKLPDDHNKWDWNSILKMLKIVLYHNQTEATSPAAYTFYSQLVSYFLGPMLLIETNQTQFIQDAIQGFFPLMKRVGYIYQILDTKECSDTFTVVVGCLASKRALEPWKPEWYLFQLLCVMMQEKKGTEILERMTLFDKLGNAIECFQTASNAKYLLSFLVFSEESTFQTKFFQSFLDNRNDEVYLEVLYSFVEKYQTDNIFSRLCFDKILVPHLRNLKNKERIGYVLTMLKKLIYHCPKALGDFATKNELNLFILYNSRLFYSVLFSNYSHLNRVSVSDEIQWWLETGNKEYLVDFDKSILDHIKNRNAENIPPPHLFQELGKTEIGIQAVQTFIPTIIQKIGSNTIEDQRAIFLAVGYFASSPQTEKLLEENQLFETILQAALQTDSYVLRGALLTALSFSSISDYLQRFLSENSFFLFTFGVHKCVIPTDITTFLPATVYAERCIESITIPEECHPDYCKLLVDMMSPFRQKNAKEAIKVANHDDQPNLLTHQMALFGHTLIGNYPYVHENRFFMQVLFKNTVMLPSVGFEIEPEVETNIQNTFKTILKKNYSGPFSKAH